MPIKGVCPKLSTNKKCGDLAIIRQKKCILPHPSGGNAQSDTSMRNIGSLSHRDVYQGVLCL